MKRIESKSCPCTSGKRYANCCRPFHKGKKRPDAAELMRSRFCAYALGLVDYIIETTDPAGPRYNHNVDQWRQELTLYCQTTRFVGLTILTLKEDEVTFQANMLQAGRPTQMLERSRFTLVNGRWLYHDGDML